MNDRIRERQRNERRSENCIEQNRKRQRTSNGKTRSRVCLNSASKKQRPDTDRPDSPFQRPNLQRPSLAERIREKRLQRVPVERADGRGTAVRRRLLDKAAVEGGRPAEGGGGDDGEVESVPDDK